MFDSKSQLLEQYELNNIRLLFIVAHTITDYSDEISLIWPKQRVAIFGYKYIIQIHYVYLKTHKMSNN